MLGLTDDQYSFLVANVAGICLALQYNYVPKSIRNDFHFLPGVIIVYYCFGRQAHSLAIYSIISYLICKYASWRNVHHFSLFSSLAFLSYAHLNRQLLDYGSYVIDISGPFMIAVQKITSLGFCLHDSGYIRNRDEDKIALKDDNNNNDDDNNNNKVDNEIDSAEPFKGQNILSPMPSPEGSMVGNYKDNVIAIKSKHDRRQMILDERKKYAVEKVPTFREFMGYFFHFPSVLCGPIVYYNDYRDFVEADKTKKHPPGKWNAIAKKLSISIICTILHLTLASRFDIQYLRTAEFQFHTSIVVIFAYILAFTMLSRLKYYVAWHLGEVISIASGLGFSGYDPKGKPKWELLSNMNIWSFETCTSMRDAILAWNKTTQVWLRRTAHDRVPKRYSVIATYALSAVWHGFYPGYYMTFLSGALFTMAARKGRRIIGPLFRKGKFLPTVYNIITFILTRLTIAYCAFPFVVLDFKGSYDLYRSMYFSLHILGVVGVLLGLVIRI